jgi:hypothetical protein
MYITLLNTLPRASDVFYRLTTVLAEEKRDGSQHYDDGYEPNATHYTPSALHPSGRLMHCPAVNTNLSCQSDKVTHAPQYPRKKKIKLTCTRSGMLTL